MRLAVNIENPADLSVSGQFYYPTPQAIEFVSRLASAALQGGGAYALQGPYGAGKSSLAAFTLHELSCGIEDHLSSRRSCLFGKDNHPAAKVLQAGGLMPMPIVGASEPLASRVALALKGAALRVQRRQRCAALQFCTSLDPLDVTPEQVLLLLTDIARSIQRQGKAGALLVVDEFGRHLEYMLATARESDFHLLQSIAEATGRTDAPLSLVIIQHYGLEHYAPKFLGTRRSEWEKVRGRFVETVLTNTEKDAAHIAGRALSSLGQSESRSLPLLDMAEPRPRLLADSDFIAATQECKPLHPMTVAILSRLARLLGQQDRTIVGWLTSDMDTGFRSVSSDGRSGWIYPDALFDHFFGEVLLVPSNPVLAKRFAAIQSAHERITDDFTPESRRLFKTLAMLSFCGGRGLNADKTSALACLPRAFPFDQCIDDLTKSSLLVYRRYRSEYVVWEGSDYDVTVRIDEAMSAISLDLAFELNQRTKRSVLAHGHLIRTGNRRSAPILWLSADEVPPPGNGEPRVLIWISDSAPPTATPSDIVSSTTIHALEPHLRESAAIRYLLKEDAALRDDAVAQKEMRSRLDFHEARISALYQDMLDSQLQWLVSKRPFSGLQKAVSTAMDIAYPSAFELHNELVNRDRVSGQITHALRKLLERLYACKDQENLGITKFPAERVIYESLFKRTGMHTQGGDGAWRLQTRGSDLPAGLRACIAEIRRLSTGNQSPDSPTIEAIADHMNAPPFGMKHTPAVLLSILIVLEDQEKHELYEDGHFLPHWGPQTLLRLLKAPGRFSFVAASPSPVGERFMNNYREALVAQEKPEASISPVSITRNLLERFAALSAYARQTQTVSATAQTFRRAIEVAKSPGDMLFRTIPQALGYKSLPSRGAAAKGYLTEVKRVWAELETADEELMDRLESIVLDTLECADIDDARAECQKHAAHMLRDSHMHHGYGEFLSRLVDHSNPNNRSWLAAIVNDGLEIQAPLAAWTDGHVAQCEFLLRRNLLSMQQAGQLLLDLELQEDVSPFAVFWPKPNGHSRKDDIEPLARELSSIVNKIPERERMSVIVDLAKEARDIV